MSDPSDEIGLVVSDVRHQINNSLMAILGYLELLLMRQDLPEDVVAKLKNMDGEAYKIREQIARTSFIRRPEKR